MIRLLAGKLVEKETLSKEKIVKLTAEFNN
jgi:hypothetical protein